MKARPKQDSRTSTALGGVLGVVLAYAFISRAFSTGSYWQYLGSLVFLVLGVKLFIRTFKK
jgi:hypothetical protein